MASGFNLFYPTQPASHEGAELSAVERLMNQFVAHEREEQEFLNGYRDIVENHQNPFVKFLLRMIIADEEKHHALVSSITTRFASDMSGHRSSAGLPNMSRVSEEEKEQLLKLTTDFLKAERDTIKEYKALLKPSSAYFDGLVVLLIKTIIHDSEKHVMILEFIEKSLKKT